MKKEAIKEANKAVKWIIRSGTAQIVIGTFTASLIGAINNEIGWVIFATNILSVVSQGVINYLDFLNSENKK